MYKEAVKGLQRVYYDYYFLLSRGYSPAQALHLIGSKYRISTDLKALIKRCIHSRELNELVRLRLVKPESLARERLCIDGFNQFYTILAGIRGKPVYRCSDGVTRDNELGAIRIEAYEIPHLSKLLEENITQLGVSETIIVFEEQIPMSREFARRIMENISQASIRAVFARKVDKFLKNCSLKYIIASSDILVILSAERVFDLAGYVLSKLSIRVNDIWGLLEEEEKKWCAGP